MSSTAITFLFETANFLVLALALAYFFFKPVRKAIVARRAAGEANERLAAQKLADAERVTKEIDVARQNLQQELSEHRAQTLRETQNQVDKLLRDARQAAERETEFSRRQAAQISVSEQDKLAQAIAAAAAETVGQLLKQLEGKELETALVNAASQQLKELRYDRLEALRIESSTALASDQRQIIEAAVGDAAQSIEYKTVEGLGFGVRVTTSAGMIDATLSGLSKFAGQAFRRELNARVNGHAASIDDSVAGDSVAGDSVAGDSVAGDTVAGDSQASDRASSKQQAS